MTFRNCQVARHRARRRLRAAVASAIAIAMAAGIAMAVSARAQMPPAPDVPNFWDIQRRYEKPDISFLRLIRFVTDDEYPPFGFTAPDGTLTGFNVELES